MEDICKLIMENYMNTADICLQVNIPHGTTEAVVQDNINLTPVAQWYVIVRALIAVGRDMRKQLEDEGIKVDWDGFLNAIFDIVVDEMEGET
ncbi:MAG: hypothetical protein J6S50_05690 [Oscillospiraceae bacterium]|nr:hypothetical protein [Lachnospiraceae bacterium]MBO7727987.1 hypothetical protein [Oscillospiraceae bacterium]